MDTADSGKNTGFGTRPEFEPQICYPWVVWLLLCYLFSLCSSAVIPSTDLHGDYGDVTVQHLSGYAACWILSAALSGLSSTGLLYSLCSHHCFLIPSLSWMFYLTPAFIHSFEFYFTAVAAPGCVRMECLWVSSTQLCNFCLCFPAQAMATQTSAKHPIFQKSGLPKFPRLTWAPLLSVPLIP